MSKYQPGELGAKFANNLEDKILLYRALDDGYGEHFHDIFTKRECKDPYLIQKIGSHHNPYKKNQWERAIAFIEQEGLTRGEWRKTWKQRALCDKIENDLDGWDNGLLGKQLVLSIPGGPLSYTEQMVAKCILLKTLDRPNMERYVFTEDDRSDIMYPAFRDMNDTQLIECVGQEKTFLYYDEARQLCKRFTPDRQFTALTFGWEDTTTGEWHLWGDLISANVIRGEERDIPALFGGAMLGAKESALPWMWADTYLCMVAVDASGVYEPELVEHSNLYWVKTLSIKSVKWLGTMERMYGTYNKNKNTILRGWNKQRKEHMK